MSQSTPASGPHEARSPEQQRDLPTQETVDKPTSANTRSPTETGSFELQPGAAELQSFAPATPPPSSAPPSLPSGALAQTFGDYELLEEIARGGMGVVYKARHKSLHRIVALKMILGGQLASDQAVHRFHQEARAAAALDHPHIVPIYDIGRQDGHHYFTMAFVEGGSLKSLVQKKGPLPPVEAATLLATIAEAVEVAHKQGLIHRDLKPENVLIDNQGRPRVTDFGLAKQVEGDAGLTAPGTILGTPSYMAPEQALGGKADIGATADVYALGGILYFLLTGKAPFQGDTVTEVLCQVVMKAPVPPRQLNPQVPPELEAVCLKCLEKNTARRYPSAAALAEVLRPGSLSATAGPVSTVSGPAASHSRTSLPSGTQSPASLTPVSDLQVREDVPTVPSSQLPRSRGFLWGALALAGALLLGIGAWLATRQRGEVVPEGPNDPTATSAQSAQSAQPAGQPADVAVQPPSRRDFGLHFEIVGGTRLPDGTWRLVDGQSVQYRVEVERDAYVGVWDFRSDGSVVQLFPHEEDRNHLVKKGQARLIPGEAGDIEARLATGPEHLQVVATTERWEPLQGQKEGPFAIFKTAQEKNRLREMLSRTRGMVFRPSPKEGKPLTAEEVVKYQVVAH